MSELSDYALDVEPTPVPDVEFPFYAWYDMGTLTRDTPVEISKDTKLFTSYEKRGITAGWIKFKPEDLSMVAQRAAEGLCRMYISKGSAHEVSRFKLRGWVLRVSFYQDKGLTKPLGSFIAKIDPDSSLTDLSITVLNEPH